MPEQEVGKSLLAAGTDDQIWIGHAGGVELGSDEVGGHILPPEAARDHLGGYGPRCARDLVAATVIERNDKVEARVTDGLFLCLDQKLSNVAGEVVAAADNTHSNVAARQLVEIAADEKLQEPHQLTDFVGRT